MLKQSTQVIQRPQPQMEGTDSGLADQAASEMAGSLLGIPGFGAIMDVFDTDDSQQTIETQMYSGGIADLQKHQLAQHMGSVLASVPDSARESASKADREKAKKHPNYIDPALFLTPRKKPVKE